MIQSNGLAWVVDYYELQEIGQVVKSLCYLPLWIFYTSLNVHVGLGCQNQNLDENQEGENQSDDLWLEGEYKDDYNTTLVRWCRKNNIKTCGIIFCCYSHSNAIKVTQMSSTSTRFH